MENQTYDYLQNRHDLIWICPSCKSNGEMSSSQLSSTRIANNLDKIMTRMDEHFELFNSRFNTIENTLSGKADKTELSKLESKIKKLTSKLLTKD